MASTSASIISAPHGLTDLKRLTTVWFLVRRSRQGHIWRDRFSARCTGEFTVAMAYELGAALRRNIGPFPAMNKIT
jgi:hypothetical protein